MNLSAGLDPWKNPVEQEKSVRSSILSLAVAGSGSQYQLGDRSGLDGEGAEAEVGDVRGW